MHSSKAIYGYVTERGWETGYYNLQKVSFVTTLLDLSVTSVTRVVWPFLANQVRAHVSLRRDGKVSSSCYAYLNCE